VGGSIMKKNLTTTITGEENDEEQDLGKRKCNVIMNIVLAE
jgi:hypothetical protein